MPTFCRQNRLFQSVKKSVSGDLPTFCRRMKSIASIKTSTMFCLFKRKCTNGICPEASDSYIRQGIIILQIIKNIVQFMLEYSISINGYSERID